MIRKPTSSFRASWVASACLAATVVCAADAPLGLQHVPATLAPPQGQALKITAHGIGVQIYECRASQSDPDHYAWTLTGPEAQLHHDEGKVLGKHYAGPTWEANDGSKVVGEVVAQDPGPDGTAISWLLLRAKKSSGHGLFSDVLSIQRVHTAGGKAPVTGCDVSYSGTQVRVAYSADYYFYAAH